MFTRALKRVELVSHWAYWEGLELSQEKAILIILSLNRKLFKCLCDPKKNDEPTKQNYPAKLSPVRCLSRN